LLRLAHHPDWRVRAQVARALAYVGQPATLPLLVELTTDREWWVRFRSAQALFRLPGVTAKLILEKVQATQDRYAIQMVESVAMTLGGA
jgi:HEAT repeat protein